MGADTHRSLTHCDIVCQWSSSSRSCWCRRRHAHGSCIMYCLPFADEGKTQTSSTTIDDDSMTKISIPIGVFLVIQCH